MTSPLTSSFSPKVGLVAPPYYQEELSLDYQGERGAEEERGEEEG